MAASSALLELSAGPPRIPEPSFQELYSQETLNQNVAVNNQSDKMN